MAARATKPLRFRRSPPRPRQATGSELSTILQHLDAFRQENRGEHAELLKAQDSARADREAIWGAHRELARTVVDARKETKETREEIGKHALVAHGLADSKPSAWVANMLTLAWWFPGRAFVVLATIALAPVAGLLAAVPEARDFVARVGGKLVSVGKVWGP